MRARKGHPYPVGLTARRTVAHEQIQHANSGTRKVGPRSNYAALCGASIKTVRRLTPFDPDHPRACPGCAASVREAVE
jgi:hypothetical protein